MHSEMNFDSSGESLPDKRRSKQSQAGRIFTPRPPREDDDGRARGGVDGARAPDPGGGSAPSRPARRGLKLESQHRESNYLWFFPFSCVGLRICLGR